MLEQIEGKNFESPYGEKRFRELNDAWANLQRKLISENKPVILILDGWESSGRGDVLKRLVKELDSKHYRVHRFTKEEEKGDWLGTAQVWANLSAKGDIGIFCASYYDLLFNDKKMKKKELTDRLTSFEKMEKLLSDDGTIILKYFLHISEKTQKENIKKLEEDPYRDLLVGKNDHRQNDNYKSYMKRMDMILKASNHEYAPWEIVPAEDVKEASRHILGHATEKIEQVLDTKAEKKSFPAFKAKEKHLAVDLSAEISDEQYHALLDDLQEKAGDLAFALYEKNIPTILVFEGNDAAGKGGAISRLIREFDPRAYRINPTSAPNDQEKDHHYLWRFYNNLPAKGEVAIFDRSWYGRVMVERIEGFAEPYEWKRAYEEICQMEKELLDHGAFILKFLLVISKDEQKERFLDREEEKSYKITEEDWRNRDKWDAYALAMEEMIEKTHMEDAPWYVISGEQKKWARIQVLQCFIQEAEKKLGTR